MDSWLLTFARAKKVYDGIIAAETSLGNKLRARGVLSGSSKRFGGLGRPVEVQDTEHYQGRPVSSNNFLDPLDDLFGALGTYNLRFVAEGRVEPLGGAAWLVTVERVGIYVQDSF